jgi:hypothetical protein
MIVFQVRQGYFGQRGWRTVGFWTWLWAEFDDRVARVVFGSCEELAADGYNWFDKRFPRDCLHELSMWDTMQDLKKFDSDLIKAYAAHRKGG